MGVLEISSIWLWCQWCVQNLSLHHLWDKLLGVLFMESSALADMGMLDTAQKSHKVCLSSKVKQIKIIERLMKILRALMFDTCFLNSSTFWLF